MVVICGLVCAVVAHHYNCHNVLPSRFKLFCNKCHAQSFINESFFVPNATRESPQQQHPQQQQHQEQLQYKKQQQHSTTNINSMKKLCATLVLLGCWLVSAMDMYERLEHNTVRQLLVHCLCCFHFFILFFTSIPQSTSL